MRGVTGRDVERAGAEMVRVLAPHVERDWDVPAGGLDWSCWQTAAHVAHDLAAYAGQFAARAGDAYLPYDLEVRAGTPPAQVLRVIEGCGRMLSDVVSAAPAGARAWHWGPTDAAGFAAMGVSETLVHTWDVTRGLAIDWEPPAGLAAAVLARLFPNAPEAAPGAALLWCTGRIALPDRPRLTSWVMKAAAG
ncbi:maleylpyruvate isomerase N-terminal domain-containing protein [Paractinoplanes rishiriensis]|uniref:Mycothiol-dependent maleylpyruvate isomerase metal-binding domain-containing protein n=1 Tax=Paractinoplanes rishiriensis TaxID=1050105 RepID=A0A919MZZ7_9ACTN|nr:maleylpyruvate isomerase N-terminal domain-containing protein [Actinoplanes rishiriensis]GIF01905.1 hypothetical protein Ari01nite_93690 [Actinoplanes rishiriensis]